MDTILLVDDNPLRASLRKSVLEHTAPEVIRVSDAAEALCLIESPEFAAGLRLVVTGHVDSGISGPDFVAELRDRLPEVPVLVLSATEKEAPSNYAGIGGVVQSGATTPDELRRAVTHMLSTPIERQTA
jgi:CheY-like chemotaxis protein